MVRGTELHPGCAHARDADPALGEAPLELRIGAAAVDAVVLVAPERAEAAEVVDEAPAPLVLPLELAADDPGQGSIEQPRIPRQAQRPAAETAVEVDHAARRGRPGTCKGEVLAQHALAVIAACLQPHPAEVVLEANTGLLLPHVLARVEQQRLRRDPARVGLELCPRQPERILRRRRQCVAHQPQLGAVFGPERQLSVQLRAPRAAVRAVAVGLEM